MTFSSIASQHAETLVNVTHRVTGLVREKTVADLLEEASNKDSWHDLDLDVDTVTFGRLCDFLCDYNIKIA